MKELNIGKKFEEIKNMKRNDSNRMVTQKIQKFTLEKLEKKKKNHSKVKENLEIQKYLKHSNIKITKEERQLIFQGQK